MNFYGEKRMKKREKETNSDFRIRSGVVPGLKHVGRMKILASVPAMQIMHVGERSLLAEAEEPLVWERALESMMTVRVGRKEVRDPVSHTPDGV